MCRLTALIALAFLAAPALAAPVEDVSQQWAGYWNAKNVKAIMTLYAPDPVFLPAEGFRWTGAASIRRHFAAGLKLYDPRLTLASTRSAASGNLAYDSGTYEEVLSPARGGKSANTRGSYLFVFQHTRHGWKILEQSWTQAPARP
ncbi:MAG TPA: DUF4440 domain-containing protein [Rhizomicrobium sp.]|nr:DUF4440 domain-containing protein [Rhizomicrobium sp.]